MTHAITKRSRNLLTENVSGADPIITLPQSDGIERSMIGAFLLDEAAMIMALDEGLAAADFNSDSFRLLFAGLQELQLHSRPLRPDALATQLGAQKLERVGGMAFIASLIDGSSPRASEIPALLSQLREVNYKRNMIRQAERLQKKASNGASLAELQNCLSAFPSISSTQSADAADYLCNSQGIFHRRRQKDSSFINDRLTNFTARITAQIVEDDGTDDIRRVYELTVTLDGETRRGFVTASAFPLMRWVDDLLGARGIIYPGKSERACCAIRVISDDIETRSVYTHTGWRKIDDEWCYLHQSGAITSTALKAVSVRLPKALDPFLLPEITQGSEPASFFYRTMKLLDVADRKLMVPLLGTVLTAVQGETDFGLFIAGGTGKGKSELSALCQSFWGAGFDARHLPASWDSSGNGIELLAFICKDGLLAIDDFKPKGSRRDDDRLHAAADRVFRSQGNHAPAIKLRADRSMHSPKTSRALLLSSGEDLPRGESLRARLIILEVEKDSVCWGRLTECQQAAREGVYATMMTIFLRWLAGQRDELLATRAQKLDEYRRHLGKQIRGHRRTISNTAYLAYGWELWLRCGVELAIFSQAEAAELWSGVQQTLIEVANAQTEYQETQDPVLRFQDLLIAALSSGQAHLAPADGRTPHEKDVIALCGWQRDHRGELQPQGTRTGWLDENYIYLEPTAAYAAVQEMANRTGDTLPISEATLWKALKERGQLLTEGSRRTLKVRRTIEGARRNVVCLLRNFLDGSLMGGKE